MQTKLLFAFLSVVVVFGFAGCGDVSSSDASNGIAPITTSITAVGTLRKQGATPYQYGTHVLKDDAGNTLYALRSSSVLLNDYVDTKVIVKGDPVLGYPLDSGPDYIDVRLIEPAKL